MDSPVSEPGLPRHAVVILLDSLNRHMVGAYGGADFPGTRTIAAAARWLRQTASR